MSKTCASNCRALSEFARREACDGIASAETTLEGLSVFTMLHDSTNGRFIRTQQSVEDRFWSKVDRSGECWLWLAAKDQKGYGKFSIGHSLNADGSRRNSMVAAHRFAYELTHGPIGNSRTFVCHACDTPACVNPAHLWLGTNADNVHDMDRKGRRVNNQPKGSAHGRAKIDEATADAIKRACILEGESRVDVARRFGVSLASVHAIVTGRQWAHVAPDITRRNARKSIDWAAVSVRIADGESQRALAREFGISPAGISKAMKRLRQ